MSDALRPHGLQHSRLSCPSLSPRVSWNSCPLSRWCYPTISSSVALFSSCPQSFPASESGSSHQVAKILELQLKRQYFQWIFQCWFALGLTGLISLQSKGLSRVFSTIVGELFTSPVLQFLHLENGSSITYNVCLFVCLFSEKKNECNVVGISSLNVNLKKDSVRIESIWRHYNNSWSFLVPTLPQELIR